MSSKSNVVHFCRWLLSSAKKYISCTGQVLLFLAVGIVAAFPVKGQDVTKGTKGSPQDILQQAKQIYQTHPDISSDQSFYAFKKNFEAYYQNIRFKTTDNSSLWSVIQNDPVRSQCGGNFQDSLLHTTEWSGGYGVIMGGINPLAGSFVTGIVPAPNSTLNAAINVNCPTGTTIPAHANETHHTIVAHGNDPILGNLLKTTSSPSNSYAFRLGNSCVQNGAEYLSKKFVVTGSGIIKFNYALVMNGIHDSTSNPSFWVKIFDNAGNLINNAVYLDALSGSPKDHIVSSSSDPFFQHDNDINYRDWTCASIDLHNYIGQTVTVALITTDCSGGAHWGYAYIDNWCGNCEGATTGTLSTVADTCIKADAEVRVAYTLPVIGSNTGTLSIQLSLYQNGAPTGYTLNSPVLTTNGIYTFTLDSSQLPCNGSGYDIVTTGHFTINSINYTLYYPDPMNTDGLKAGQNNDIKCCQTTAGICNLTDVRITPSPGGICCYFVEISNKYSSQYFSGISITSGNLSIANVSSANSWSTIAYQSPGQVIFEKISGFNGIPLDGAAGWQPLGSLCFAGNLSGSINVAFIGPAPEYDTICSKALNVACATPVDTSCVAIIDLKTECDSGVVKMKFRIKNNSNFIMRGITLYSQSTNVLPSPNFIPIADLLPGQTTTGYYETVLQLSGNDTNACFFFAACDQNTRPGDNGQYPQFCCMDSILYCVSIPHCNPCDAIEITAVKDSGASCCYKLTLVNHYTSGTIKCIRFRGQSGAQFALLSGWNIQSPVSSSNVTMCAPGGVIQPVTYSDFASFCLTGTSTPPHHVVIEFIDDKDSVVCIKELSFDSCTLVKPTCASIVNDSLYCDGSVTKYTFSVKNNAPFAIYQLDVRLSDTSIHVDKDIIIPSSPIPPGATGGPYSISITNGFEAGKDFCIYLSAHNNVYNPDSGIAATQCCTDSLAVLCFPYFSCKDSTGCCTCCDFSQFSIPTGITPNQDLYNDEYNLHQPDSCATKITVYNRWGNIVYEETNYKNTWKGTNKKGEQLPQGTYFVVIELASGNKKGTYVDIRY